MGTAHTYHTLQHKQHKEIKFNISSPVLDRNLLVVCSAPLAPAPREPRAGVHIYVLSSRLAHYRTKPGTLTADCVGGPGPSSWPTGQR